MTNYVVATIKPWNIEAYHRRVPNISGQWHLIGSQSELTLDKLKAIGPRYIFFPHWSWRVPEEILAAFECVCFHMTDVPYGRGGSPLQNLIVRGHRDTKVSALRMVAEMDAGPVYLKLPLSLEGRAEEIFQRLADVTFDIISTMVASEPIPIPQSGEPVVFVRRRSEESELPHTGSIPALYDHIRMLDAKTYPPAFLEWGDFRLEFVDAGMASNALEARVVIRRKEPTP